MPPEVLVFDMDGVLVDVTESYRGSIRATVHHFSGHDISPEAIQDFKNQGGWNNDWELTHRILRDLGCLVEYVAVVDRFQKIFFGYEGAEGLILRERWIAGPGLLERLSERFQLAIFTGRLREELDPTLARFAPALRFEPIITTESVSNTKPAPDGLLKIAELAQGRKLRYVGDTVDDARSARAAGVPFIGIASPSNPRYRDLVCLLREEGAVAVLDDINQLESVLG